MKKSLSKWLAAAVAVALCVAALAGCGTDKEALLEQTAEADMQSAVETLTADGNAVLLDGIDTETLEGIGVDPDTFAQALMDKFQLEVKSVEVDGDTGTATVRIISINQSTQLKAWIDEMTEWSTSDAAHELYAEQGDEAVDSYIADAFLGVYTDPDAVMKTVEKKLTYTWTDGAWQLDGGLDAFVEELVGDLDFTGVL
jgi:hypothetical protein